MRVVLAGISHHRSPVELRELAALDRERADGLAAALADGGEAVCLSTCNRTELVLAGEDPAATERRALDALGHLAGVREAEILPLVYRLHDEAAALHLFRVAAGLDSMVPGEGEILGQVRAAWDGGSTGPILDHLFGQALHAGRRARSQTAIGESPTSVSAAAAVLAQQVFGELAGRRVLLVGAGRVAELAARNLLTRGAEIVSVASRSLERAEDFARRFGGAALQLDGVEAELAGADVVVSSTGAPGAVLQREQVARAVRGRRGRPLLLIDLAVPRDLDRAIHDLEGCYLYDIDDLEAVVAETLANRRREAARAEEIVVEEAERFRAWHASLEVVPAIASLHARAEEIRVGELAKAEGRLGRLSASERHIVDSLTAQIVSKLLHLPTVRLKEAAAAAEGAVYADTVRHLFGLTESKDER